VFSEFRKVRRSDVLAFRHKEQSDSVPESSNVPVVPPSTETATRPLEIKLRYDSQKGDPDSLYPPPCAASPKLVEISAHDDAGSHGSLTPKGKCDCFRAMFRYAYADFDLSFRLP
jgi:hypothetical protein